MISRSSCSRFRHRANGRVRERACANVCVTPPKGFSNHSGGVNYLRVWVNSEAIITCCIAVDDPLCSVNVDLSLLVNSFSMIQSIWSSNTQGDSSRRLGPVLGLGQGECSMSVEHLSEPEHKEVL